MMLIDRDFLDYEIQDNIVETVTLWMQEIRQKYLNTLPQEACKRMREIQNLDRKSQQIQTDMYRQQQELLDRYTKINTKKVDGRTRQQAESQLKEILKMQRQLRQMCNQKIRIAEALYMLVHQPTQRLELELSRLSKEMKRSGEQELEDRSQNRKRLKDRIRLKEKEAEYKNQPVYCYCSKPSYGVMVECDNKFCEKEWFHKECIGEKVLPDKWFCNDCKKNRKKQLRYQQ